MTVVLQFELTRFIWVLRLLLATTLRDCGVDLGYDNVRIDGHVERHVNDTEMAIVRRMFELSTEGREKESCAANSSSARQTIGKAQGGFRILPTIAFTRTVSGLIR